MRERVPVPCCPGKGPKEGGEPKKRPGGIAEDAFFPVRDEKC